VPQQALFLMNSPFVASQAEHLARLTTAHEGGSADPEETITRLYRRLFGRPPEPSEIEVGVRFLASQEDRTAAPSSPWRYGYGTFNEQSGRVEDFQPLSHWTGDRWQFGAEWPHPVGKHLHLTAEGGHPGPDSDRAVIRRWVAPTDAVVSIDGILSHGKERGDGVRGRIVAERRGVLGEWVVRGDQIETLVDRLEARAGEAIDFVIDCRGGPAFDSFDWAPIVHSVSSDGSLTSSDSLVDFGGPTPEPPTPAEQYAQALLMTNEFVFVD